MNNLLSIKSNNDGSIGISGRELHEFLEVKTPYKKWFDRMADYGFNENVDFTVMDKNVHDDTAFGGIRKITDHILTIACAKEIAMIQRTDRGKQARQYFIEIERQWNTPQNVIARALQMSNQMYLDTKKQLDASLQKIALDAPKVVLADCITASTSTLYIGDLAKFLKQNGIDIGRNRLFQWLRENGYLMRQGTANIPTQRSMNMGLFEMQENPYIVDGQQKVSITTKVTGKGQQYFLNLFKQQVA